MFTETQKLIIEIVYLALAAIVIAFGLYVVLRNFRQIRKNDRDLKQSKKLSNVDGVSNQTNTDLEKLLDDGN